MSDLSREAVLSASQSECRDPDFSWKPEPVPPPQADRELPAMPPVRRSAEIIRYCLLALENFASPEGSLREWCRLVLLLSALLFVPCVSVLPVTVWFAAQCSLLSGYLATVAVNLASAAAASLAAAVLICLTAALLRAAFRRLRAAPIPPDGGYTQ